MTLAEKDEKLEDAVNGWIGVTLVRFPLARSTSTATSHKEIVGEQKVAEPAAEGS